MRGNTDRSHGYKLSEGRATLILLMKSSKGDKAVSGLEVGIVSLQVGAGGSLPGAGHALFPDWATHAHGH